MKPDSFHLAAGDGDEDFRQGRASSDAAPSAGFPDKPLKPGAVVLHTVRGVDEIPMWVRPEDFPPVPKPAHRFDYTDLFTRGQMWEYILAERAAVAKATGEAA